MDPTGSLFAGDVGALARAISAVERGGADSAEILRLARERAGRAVTVGVTGPPGAGKSTLIDRLIAVYRRAGSRVAVLAIDPSSPFTGGALLGDRVRMQAHAGDADVYVRSMASRGALGGVAKAAADAVTLLDAAGYTVVLVETVGVGQGEVDIARVADVTVVLAVPGAGDDIQALKAGLMEIGDIFVVNKADRGGADATAGEIEATLSLAPTDAGAWRPPVIRVSAATGAGVDDLVAAIDACWRASGHTTAHRRQRARWRMEEAVRERALASVMAGVDHRQWDALVDRVADGATDPVSAAGALLAGARRAGAGRLDHVGIATDDAAATRAFFESVLGLTADAGEDVTARGVRVWFLGQDDTRLELVAPTTESSPVAAFLRKRGPGLHHVAFRVDDLVRTLAELRARGVRLIDDAPRQGAQGRQVAFVHPSSTKGVLVELVQREGPD